MLIFCACEKQDEEILNPVIPDGTHALKSGASIIETPLELSGDMQFYVYAIKEYHLVIDSKLPMEAILTHVGSQSYILDTKEYTPPEPLIPSILYRTMSIDVKITPGGQVRFSWPEPGPDTWWELPGTHPDGIAAQVSLHTGYDLHGPGINKGTLDYMGSFNGEEFYAKWQWTGKQLVPGEFGPYMAKVDGLIKLEFSFELTVD